MLQVTKWIITLILIVSIPFYFSCSGNDVVHEDDNFLIINDFTMTKTEFQTICADEMEYNTIYKTSTKRNQALLDCIIKKELLIQEAKRRGIDKGDKFITAIEKYWESTLIKLLMEKKNQEIQNITTISEKEINKEYDELKVKDETLPTLSTIEKEIATEILERKKTKTIENWIESLRTNASIKFDEKFIRE